jgi:hypothetical protein
MDSARCQARGTSCKPTARDRRRGRTPLTSYSSREYRHPLSHRTGRDITRGTAEKGRTRIHRICGWCRFRDSSTTCRTPLLDSRNRTKYVLLGKARRRRTRASRLAHSRCARPLARESGLHQVWNFEGVRARRSLRRPVPAAMTKSEVTRQDSAVVGLLVVVTSRLSEYIRR